MRRSPRPQIALADSAARHFEHLVEALLGCKPQTILDLNARLEVAQRGVELLHRVERHVGADIAAAVAVSPRRADEMLFRQRSEEHTSELQSLMRISYAVFCLKKKKTSKTIIKIQIKTRRQYKA